MIRSLSLPGVRYNQGMNAHFRVAFGDYELSLDRRSLTFDLTDTKSGVSWGADLSVGWIELEERATGTVVRHPFGACRTVSLSEKMGPLGKRLLLGLDAPGGIPVDIYLSCTAAEVQLTVDASRDTATHRVGRIGLLPGLCHVPEARDGWLVLPIAEGRVARPIDLPSGERRHFPVWPAGTAIGLTMPFCGAVRPGSALALLTDSAYAVAEVAAGTIDWMFSPDPERRRLDLRLVIVPGGDPIALARLYREKRIGEGGHVTLRKKRRERPALDRAIGTALEMPEDAIEVADNANRWEALMAARDALACAVSEGRLAVASPAGDWAAIEADAWIIARCNVPGWRSYPLLATVYRDAVLALGDAADPYRQNFGAFVASHHWLDPEFRSAEIVYTDKTRAIIHPI